MHHTLPHTLPRTRFILRLKGFFSLGYLLTSIPHIVDKCCYKPMRKLIPKMQILRTMLVLQHGIIKIEMFPFFGGNFPCLNFVTMSANSVVRIDIQRYATKIYLYHTKIYIFKKVEKKSLISNL